MKLNKPIFILAPLIFVAILSCREDRHISNYECDLSTNPAPEVEVSIITQELFEELSGRSRRDESFSFTIEKDTVTFNFDTWKVNVFRNNDENNLEFWKSAIGIADGIGRIQNLPACDKTINILSPGCEQVTFYECDKLSIIILKNHLGDISGIIWPHTTKDVIRFTSTLRDDEQLLSLVGYALKNDRNFISKVLTGVISG